MKNLVFSFVLLLGLFSCGEEKSSSSASTSNNALNKPANGTNNASKNEKININSLKQPNCEDIDGIEDCSFDPVYPENYTGILKCCENQKVMSLNIFENGECLIIKTWHKNGKIQAEFNTPKGIVRSWHENGQLSLEGHSIDGRMNGLVRMWDENGRLESEDYWKNGKPWKSKKSVINNSSNKIIGDLNGLESFKGMEGEGSTEGMEGEKGAEGMEDEGYAEGIEGEGSFEEMEGERSAEGMQREEKRDLTFKTATVVVSSGYLYFRKAPYVSEGTKFKDKKYRKLLNKTVVKIISKTKTCQTIDNNYNCWYQIEYLGKTGFVFGAYLKFN